MSEATIYTVQLYGKKTYYTKNICEVNILLSLVQKVTAKLFCYSNKPFS